MDLRSGPRALLATGVLAVTLGLTASPAVAQATDTSSTTSHDETTSSTGPDDPGATSAAPETGTEAETPAPTSSAPEPSPTAPTTAPPPEPTTTTSDPGAAPQEMEPSTAVPEPTPADGEQSPDEESTTVDPLIDEHQGEDAPETDETVPPPGGAYAGQPEFQPAEVLWSSVRTAEAKLGEARAVEEQLIARAREVRLAHKQLRATQASLDADTKAAADDIRRAETALRDRAVSAFMSDDALTNAVIGSFDAADHDKVLDLQVRRTLLGAALDQDEDAIAAYLALRTSLDSRALATLDAIRHTERTLSEAIDEVDVAREAVVQAENELGAFRAGSAIYIDGVVFPVGDGYGLPLIDSFGFPRMPGTPDEHWHEGIDIFAPAGTPLLAAERSVVTRVGSGRLGGLTVWLRGESGTDWYYAHLQSHAPDLVPGLVVEAGHVVGYVGNTGNAISTPPHLHLEMHPGGGEPVNPYPLLKVISDRDQHRA